MLNYQRVIETLAIFMANVSNVSYVRYYQVYGNVLLHHDSSGAPNPMAAPSHVGTVPDPWRAKKHVPVR